MDEDRAPIDQFEEMIGMAIELMNEQLTYGEVIGTLQTVSAAMVVAAHMADQALGS